MYLLQGVNLQLRPRILSDSAARLARRVPCLQHERLGAGPARQRHRPQRLSLDRAGQGRGHLAGRKRRRKFTLNLKQAFQKLTGTATVNGVSTPVTGKLNGNAIELSADLGGGVTTLRGEIKGDAIGGGNLRATRS